MSHVAPVVDLEPLENEPPEQPYRQAIWPLILMASVMVGVGFYAAISQGGEYTFKYAPKPLEPTTPSLLTDLKPALLEQGLTLKIGEESSMYRMRQTSQVGGADTQGKAVGMKASFRVMRDIKQKKVEQSFSSTQLLLWQETETNPVSVDVSIQIETILADAKATFELTPQGELTDYTWTSALNPQLRPTFKLFADAQAILAPRFKAGALRPNDSWTYSLPWAGKAATLDTSASVNMTMTYKGMIQGASPRAVIAVVVETSGSIGDGAQVIGEGNGVLELSVDAQGQADVVRFALAMTQTLEHKGQSTNMSLAFERARWTP